ncbi:MAG: hypothetical protein Kow00121_09800 [Elainellaceae cyanobacterium]
MRNDKQVIQGSDLLKPLDLPEDAPVNMMGSRIDMGAVDLMEESVGMASGLHLHDDELFKLHIEID